MRVFDFDHPEEWVADFAEDVAPVAGEVKAEIDRQREWGNSGLDVRAFTREPDAPKKDAVLTEISSVFAASMFRAFHATRLIDPEEIFRDGLVSLDRMAQIARVIGAYEASPAHANSARLAAWRAWTPDRCELATEYREGDCWLTPSRSLLHDGGLDTAFRRFGGEFLERISDDPDDLWAPADEDPGEPTVVVAVLPPNWCANAPEFGPRRILHEVMAHLGHPLDESLSPFWDVQVGRDIPPDKIELVCGRDDLRVADRGWRDP